ncbi:hypothetical protein KL942_002383 [Ogataea angusta]|uniref:CAP-Gly domain-containing protein n=1 Tax=Pichia angusta TaxID=870730 RepID=A0ABQ7RZ48_PICAN|nr:hypothetical protein KL942_002383 [Ogataea angusta]KAG7850340.1 hypothetical protein KL940_001900 [Ogataea angusta]
MLVPGDRVAVDGFLATVRFVGEIPNWPNETAIGIEWDVPERGKNDGSLNGTRYFTTLHGAKSGSFVKPSKLQPTRSFMDAMVYQYASDESLANESASLVDHFDLTIGTKKVESYGFEKLSRLQADFRNLETATLERLNVAVSSPIDSSLHNLQVLDLGFNLLDWHNLMQIVLQLPNLHTLKANGNRWTRYEPCTPCLSVRTLHLAACDLGNSQYTAQLLSCFPKLQHLHVASNGLKYIEVCGLESLDLSDNSFTLLSDAPPAKRLNLSYNDLHIPSLTETSLQIVEELDLCNTAVSEWSEIDNLAQLPNLTSLRILNTPLLNSTDYDSAMCQLFARIPSLVKLDGTVYTTEHRDNFELYFISKVRSKEWSCPQPLWTTLCAKHGVSTQETTPAHQHPTSTCVEVVYDTCRFSATLFSSATVGKLRGKISRKLGLSVLDFQLYTQLGHDIEHLANDQQIVAALGLANPVQVELQPWESGLRQQPYLRKSGVAD